MQIKFGPNAKSKDITEYSLRVLKDILTAAGVGLLHNLQHGENTH